MGHIGQKFRFVFAGNSQFFGFFFNRLTSVFQFLIFLFQKGLLLFEGFGLAFEFFVGDP
jgi:hypothetical protein